MRIVPALAAVMLATGAAYADPHKVDPQDGQARKATAPVVLASADTPRADDVPQPAPAPPKHSAGRVTHCRCGDPQPDSQKPDR